MPLEHWQCLFYFPALCDSIVHVVCVCGWSCTLYDGLLRLHEWPLLITSALDLVLCVCAQGNCCRCIFMLYCMHDHRGVIVLIHVTWVTLVSLCMWHASTYLMLWRVLTRYNTSMSIHIVYIDAKPCWCAIAHQTWNFVGFSPWKLGTLLPYSHSKNLVRIAFCVLWCT